MRIAQEQNGLWDGFNIAGTARHLRSVVASATWLDATTRSAGMDRWDGWMDGWAPDRGLNLAALDACC